MKSPIVYHISIDILCIHIDYIYHISYRFSMFPCLPLTVPLGTGFMSEMGLAVAMFPANTATSLVAMRMDG